MPVRNLHLISISVLYGKIWAEIFIELYRTSSAVQNFIRIAYFLAVKFILTTSVFHK